MRIFVGLETEGKPRFLNHEDPRAWSLTNLEDRSFTNFIWKCCKSPKDSLLSSKLCCLLTLLHFDESQLKILKYVGIFPMAMHV